MHDKFVTVKWLNCPHIFISDKNVQNIGLKGNIN